MPDGERKIKGGYAAHGSGASLEELKTFSIYSFRSLHSLSSSAYFGGKVASQFI